MGPSQPAIGNNRLPPFATTNAIRQIGAICGALRLVDGFVNDSRALRLWMRDALVRILVAHLYAGVGG